ncbi:hypothetical protein CEP51_004457 [Fusarium floridanum]|uniref:Uncharacterized protein n=1 Tax=Fusarium floridanum TaxID=1325733 RepID=A0A428S101_9HYPO|nr:hypothetical protein CEP51_004457 [Fusarium floridanum]
MADPISVAAGVVSLVARTQGVIKAVSSLRTSSVDRGLLDRLWLFQKIISRSADVLPQALEDQLFREHHEETMQLCLAQCARLIPQLEEHIHKATKNPLRSVLFDQNIVGALEQLETWSKLLSEEMNQWKIAETHRMVTTVTSTVQEMKIHHDAARSRVPRTMVEDLLSRCSEEEIPVDMIESLLTGFRAGVQKGIPTAMIEDLWSQYYRRVPSKGIPRAMIEDLLTPFAHYDRGRGIPSSVFVELNTHDDSQTQRPFISVTQDDTTPPTEAQETASTTPAQPSTASASRLHRELEQVSERLRELSKLGTESPFLFPFVVVPDDPQAPTPAPFRVKLDSGCDLNWISARIVKRAGLEDKQEEVKCDKAWQGFSGGQELIVPQATITLTWYSVNAAYTHRHEFLVHHQVPFDVVLGSRFIIEEGWKKSFNDPVLALRYSELSDEQLREIHHKARQNKEATEAQRQAEREMRSRDRQARRQFGLSRTGTPRSLLSRAGSQAISPRMSMATINGHSPLRRSPLSAQQPHPTNSEDSIAEPPGPLPTTTTQQGAVPGDLEVTSVAPSVQIVTEPEVSGI